jgi:hypothetical protein
MSYFFNPKPRRMIEDFKHELSQLAETTETKQEAIASDLGVSQPCIAHWMDVMSDRQFPAALIPLLPYEIRREILWYLERQCGEPTAIPNGTIDDDVTNLSQATGAFIQQYREDKSAKAKLVILANEMKLTIDGLIAEVELTK